MEKGDLVKLVKVTPTMRTVNIEISAGNALMADLVNHLLVSTLSGLKRSLGVKNVLDNGAVIVLVPDRETTVQELFVDVKQLIGRMSAGTAQ